VEVKYINVQEVVNCRVENKLIKADCHMYEQHLCLNFADINTRNIVIITTLGYYPDTHWIRGWVGLKPV
jgi:hypothetical protein